MNIDHEQMSSKERYKPLEVAQKETIKDREEHLKVLWDELCKKENRLRDIRYKRGTDSTIEKRRKEVGILDPSSISYYLKTAIKDSFDINKVPEELLLKLLDVTEKCYILQDGIWDLYEEYTEQTNSYLEWKL